MKNLLSNLSSALLKYHRELLFFQATLAEKNDHRQYSPYELLNLTLNDARFAWLKKYSELIIQIDIITDDKEDKAFDAHAIYNNVKSLISPDSAEASEDYRFALKSDTSLMLSLGEVRKALHALEVMLKTQLT